MKIYVMCDLEGVAGVVNHRKQCWVDGDYFAQARRMATQELNALVEGAFAGGATQIIAWDGHVNYPGGIDVETLDPRCRLIMGAGGGAPTGLDHTYDAMFLHGAHAMAGTEWAVLAHTFRPHIVACWLNELKIGEIGIHAAVAGSFSIPTVFVSGDRAACEEAQTFVPDIVTAVVKSGLQRAAAGLTTVPTNTVAAEKARELIRDAARSAAERVGTIPPFHIESPFVYRVQYTDKRVADEKALMPWVRRVGNTAVETEGNDLLNLPL